MPADDSDIHCRLDELLEARGMTLTELSKMVGVSLVNLSVLKNDRARAIRFSTLTAICDALDCQVGDLLVTVDVQVPKELDGEAKAAVEALRAARDGVDPRANLFEEAKK